MNIDQNNIIERLESFINKTEISRNKIIIKKDFVEQVAYIKEVHRFNKLKNINIEKQKENLKELNYTLYSSENEEEILIACLIKDKAESLVSLYKNSLNLEYNISKQFNIHFVRS